MSHKVAYVATGPYALRCGRFGVSFDLFVYAGTDGATELGLQLLHGDGWIYKAGAARPASARWTTSMSLTAAPPTRRGCRKSPRE